MNANVRFGHSLLKTHKTIALLLTIAALGLAACGATGSEGGDCPPPGAGLQTLTNVEHGYCLTYPSKYQVERPHEQETALVIESLLNMQDPRVYIEVDESMGRTTEDVAESLVQEVQASLPDWPIEVEHVLIDGVDAIVLDRMPGQDITRQVVVVNNGLLYQFMFAPASEEYGADFDDMETLFSAVIDSFNFLP